MSEAPEETRIGVFVCDCGTNIAGFMDVPSVVEYARTLPDVVFVQENMYTCSDAGITEIKNAIKEHDLNRVVVASCTPRTHAPLFMAACEAAGLNKYLFEFVNIRDQCSWVHMGMPEEATQKAEDLIRMGVAKATHLEPRDEMSASIEPTTLVIGGGIAGLSAARSLSNQGFSVHIIEIDEELGGTMRHLNSLFPDGSDPREVVGQLIKEIMDDHRVTVHLSTTLKQLTGYLGNFEATIAGNGSDIDDETISVGTIILATGSTQYMPRKLYGFGKDPEVITQMELEVKLRDDTLGTPRSVVMIQCAGARGQGVAYCSRTCCMTALKNARLLRKRFPDSEVYILHRGMQTYGQVYESYYRQAREEGVRFILFNAERPPEVSSSEGVLNVEAFNPTLRKIIDIDCDLVVLSNPQAQHENAVQMAQMLKVPLGQDGFYFEAHSKLRPVDFATDGVFLCGTARGPATVGEVVQQALGAAARAAIPMALGTVQAEAIVAQVDPEICSGCRNCETVCPYGAIGMVPIEGGVVAEINPLLCKGCGTCVPECPSRAIHQWGFTDDQMMSQVLEAVESKMPEDEPNIVGFCCNWCSYAGADMAGVGRFQYAPNIRIIRTMCSGRVDPIWIIRAFMEGADGVFVSGCHPNDCHYSTGNQYSKGRVHRLKSAIEEYGIDPRRLRLEWISASEGIKFSLLVNEFTEEIKRLGMNPMKKAKDRRIEDVKEA